MYYDKGWRDGKVYVQETDEGWKSLLRTRRKFWVKHGEGVLTKETQGRRHESVVTHETTRP